jgi:hypothetical protein
MSTNQISGTQVAPLPIGSGGSNTTKRQMNSLNTELAMLNAQAAADTKYDPPVPKPITKPSVIEKFQSDPLYTAANTLIITGILMVVYGFVTK